MDSEGWSVARNTPTQFSLLPSPPTATPLAARDICSGAWGLTHPPIEADKQVKGGVWLVLQLACRLKQVQVGEGLGAARARGWMDGGSAGKGESGQWTEQQGRPREGRGKGYRSAWRHTQPSPAGMPRKATAHHIRLSWRRRHESSSPLHIPLGNHLGPLPHSTPTQLHVWTRSPC